MKLKLKVSIVAVLMTVMTAASFGAVNDDYNSDYTATRKLGRSVSNIVFGLVEIPKTMVEVNELEGPAASITTGLFEGISRFFQREVVGVCELFTFLSDDKEPIITPEYPFGAPIDEPFILDIEPNDHSDHELHGE